MMEQMRRPPDDGEDAEGRPMMEQTHGNCPVMKQTQGVAR